MDREQPMSTAERTGPEAPGRRNPGISSTETRLADGTALRSIDPLVADLIARESRRQEERVILIASESRPHPAVMEALASPFTSIYAEGHPSSRLRASSLDELSDVDGQLAVHRHLGNRRFYQGAELADLIECVAERRTAACFATGEWPAESIYVNVQPLSGSVANLAVYEALLEPGDTILAMALTEGGHLTHGSPYSVSGKLYRPVFYGTDPESGRLDYDEILRLAKKHRPKLVIGGFTSYPWQPDWAQFRAIADEVGAFLLTDIAHTAGMVVGGVYPNPIGIADVVSLTTHKSLCGPRAAALLSTDARIARRLDRAVFPGLQGGPHVNKMAAIAVAMRLARSDDFRALQQRTVDNAARLARALRENGLTLAYGGTDTHLVLVDLRPLAVPAKSAAHWLDLAGIVCNRNVVPGDRSGADAHGLRFGTTWVSQRRMGDAEMDALADVISGVLTALALCPSRSGDETLDKSPMEAQLDAANESVRELLAHVSTPWAP